MKRFIVASIFLGFILLLSCGKDEPAPENTAPDNMFRIVYLDDYNNDYVNTNYADYTCAVGDAGFFSLYYEIVQAGVDNEGDPVYTTVPRFFKYDLTSGERTELTLSYEEYVDEITGFLVDGDKLLIFGKNDIVVENEEVVSGGEIFILTARVEGDALVIERAAETDLFLNRGDSFLLHDGYIYELTTAAFMRAKKDGGDRVLIEATDIVSFGVASDGIVVRRGDGSYAKADFSAKTLTPIKTEPIPERVMKRGEAEELAAMSGAPASFTELLSGDGRRCFKNAYGIYAYDGENVRELLSWSASDLLPSYIQVLSVETSDLVFVKISDPMTKNRFRPAALLRVPEEERAVKTYISMAAIGPQNLLDKLITTYNLQNERYRVVYDKYDTADDFNVALAAGKFYDVIMTNMPEAFNTLAARNYFSDLSPHLGDSILDSVAKAYGGGKMYFFPTSVSFLGIAAHKGGFDLSALPEEKPGVRTLSVGGDALFNFSMSASAGDYTDGNVCRFDSPDFIALLEYCGAMPKTDRSYFAVPAYAVSTQFSSKLFDGLCDGTLLSYLLSLGNLKTLMSAEFAFSGDYDFYGFPYSGRSLVYGASYYAITADAASQDGARSFLEFCISDERDYYSSGSFPVTKSALHRLLSQYVGSTFYLDKQFSIGVSAPGEPLRNPMMSRVFDEAYADYAYGLINGIDAARADPTVVDIVCEEAAAFFAGDVTADVAAALIQNRVSTLLAERG